MDVNRIARNNACSLAAAAGWRVIRAGPQPAPLADEGAAAAEAARAAPAPVQTAPAPTRAASLESLLGPRAMQDQASAARAVQLATGVTKAQERLAETVANYVHRQVREFLAEAASAQDHIRGEGFDLKA